MIKINFCYSKTTEESASVGDYSDNGFYDCGWEYSTNNPEVYNDYSANPDLYRKPWKPGDLRQAIEEARNLGIHENQGAWWASVDPDIDYRTGEQTLYSFHVDGITESTRKRINRLLNG